MQVFLKSSRIEEEKIQHSCTKYKGYLTISQCMKANVCNAFVWVPGCMVWCHGTCVEVRGPQESPFPCVTQRRSRHQTSCSASFLGLLFAAPTSPQS